MNKMYTIFKKNLDFFKHKNLIDIKYIFMHSHICNVRNSIIAGREIYIFVELSDFCFLNGFYFINVIKCSYY